MNLTAELYSRSFDGKAPHIYATAAFNRLNAPKVARVAYLAMAAAPDAGPTAGLAAGVDTDSGLLRAPFSAPFNSLTFTGRSAGITLMTEVYAALADHAAGEGLHGVELFMPPAVYNPGGDAADAAALQGAGYRLVYADINYHFETHDIAVAGSYAALLPRRAARYLRGTHRDGMRFVTDAAPARAYAVIEANRRAKGYPLRMSLSQVLDTIALVEADFFVLADMAGRDLAAAMVYHVCDGIVQVIYWGDIPEAEGSPHCMLRLAEEVFSHYAARGTRIVDVGPSSERGIASHGLCRFKETIGCRATLKGKWRRDTIPG